MFSSPTSYLADATANDRERSATTKSGTKAEAVADTNNDATTKPSARALRAQRRASLKRRAASAQTAASPTFDNEPSQKKPKAATTQKAPPTRSKMEVDQTEEDDASMNTAKSAVAAASSNLLNSSSCSVVPTRPKAPPHAQNKDDDDESREHKAPLLATVTPGNPRRQINFDPVDPSRPPGVPPNIVNLFPDVNDKTRCSCPMEPYRMSVASRDLGKVFLSQYGKEHLDFLQSSESQQFAHRKRAIVPNTELDDSVSHVPDSPDSSQYVSEYNGVDKGILQTLLEHDCTRSKTDARFLESNERVIQTQPSLTPRMRAVLVSWMAECAQEYHISDNAYHLAVSLLDVVILSGPGGEAAATTHRPLCGHSDSDGNDDDESQATNAPDSSFVIHKEQLQALGCVCTWLAAKIEDRTPPSQDDFSFISDHSVTTADLRQLECRVCNLLSFNLQQVTPFHFVNVFLRASQACPCRYCEYEHPVLRQMVQYLLYLARLSVELMDERPSRVAAAAVYLARATLDIQTSSPSFPAKEAHKNPYWSCTLEHYTGYSVEDLQRCVLFIYRYQLQAQQLGAAAYEKFKKPNKQQVSLRTARLVEDLCLPGVRQNHESLHLTASTPAELYS